MRINGFQLKVLACVTMLVDHTAALILYFYLIYLGNAIGSGMLASADELTGLEHLTTMYQVMRGVGRLAFPIFAFLLVEGFLHTRSVKKYLRNLLIFAVISEIPFDLGFYSVLWYAQAQNVYWTLLLGLLCLCWIRYWEEKTGNQEVSGRGFAFTGTGNAIRLYGPMLLGIALLAGIAELLKTDYGAWGVIVIVLLYLFRNMRYAGGIFATLTLCIMSIAELPALLDVILIDRYDGSRGRQAKYFFYVFYPAHLLLLYIISYAMGVR